MRDLILKRIDEIRELENGFPRGVTKWDNFSTGTVKRHLNEINFPLLEDAELLFLFERLIKRYNQQS